MGWCACCATSGRCRASSGGGVGGWSASASTPFTRSQPRSRKAFPPCFVAVCGWVVCAKNWQLGVRNTVCFPCLRHIVTQGPQFIQSDAKAFLHRRLKGIHLALKRITSCANGPKMRFAKDALQGHRRGYEVCGAPGGHGRCQVLLALLGTHQNGSASTASAAVSIAS